MARIFSDCFISPAMKLDKKKGIVHGEMFHSAAENTKLEPFYIYFEHRTRLWG